MDLKEYLLNQQQLANVDESLILGLLCGGLFGGIFGGLFGLFSKKQKEEYDENSSYNRRRQDDDDEDDDKTKKKDKDKDKETGAAETNTVNELGAKKPLNKMTAEEQEKWMLKTQFLMQKEIDKDPDSDESKRSIALMNQVNACMYDENGNLRSPEDREKFCKENIDPDASFDDIMADYKKAADKAAFKQPNDLNSIINFDSVTDEDVESQRNKSKESAKSTLTTLARQKEADPEGDSYMNLMTACGYSEADRKEAKKRIDTKRAMQKAESDKAEAMAAFEQKKADITKDPSLSDDEKASKIKDAEKEKDDKIKEIDDNLKKTIKDLGGDVTTTSTGAGEPEPKPEPKPGEGDDKFKDEDGNEYRKDGDKYYMKDGKGEEIEIEKKDFEEAQKNAVNDDETEDETKNSTFEEDPEDDEVDDKGNSKKDPRKVWKKKTYKRGNKSFKTKSYYNKKGNSISAEEFKEKVKNFVKSQKPNESFMDLSSYMKMIFS